MAEDDYNKIIHEVTTAYNRLIEYSEAANLESFLSYYENSPTFLSIAADGKMSDFNEFSKACKDYYNNLKEQKVITLRQKYHVIDNDLVIVAWTGNIIANLKNGDTVFMRDYSITSLFKKIDGNWKIIHDHESALPPEIKKQ